MKNLIKKISALLFSVVILMSIFSMTVPFSAENEGTGTYISAMSGLVIAKEDYIVQWDVWDISLVEFQKNADMLSERGYKSLWFDFNQQAHHENVPLIGFEHFAPLAIGYQTTTDRNDAITGIVACNVMDPEATIELNGITYNLMSGWEYYDEVVAVAGLDMNRFTEGEYIFLYYTKDVNAGEPITALMGSNDYTESGYECVLNTTGNASDLNEGSKMSIPCTVYLHYQREASGTGSIFGGNTTLVIIIVAAVVVVGAGLAIFFTMKKKGNVK